MLRRRIITGVIAAPVALAGVFLLPAREFAVFIGAVLTVAAWEWANFAGLSNPGRCVYAVLVALALAGVFFLPAPPVLLLGAAWWCVALILVSGYPRWNELWGGRAVVLITGLPVLLPGFCALLALKHHEHGNYLICLLFFLVWGADIGAYFSGKAFGRRKLAPGVSPGKSWAGFAGGVTTAAVIAGLMALYFGAPAPASPAAAGFILACAMIAMISVLGDLTISMFKRHRRIKDAGSLLPGHGGFLDRIDSLLSAAPVFTLYVLWATWI